jgi:hypothetical protein
MHVYSCSLVSASEQDEDQHRIDPTAPQGLLDVVVLGNTMELVRYLDARFYQTTPSETINDAELAEYDFITEQYSVFQKAFSNRYVMVIDEKRVDVINHLFKPSILHLAVSIVTYRRGTGSFEAGYDEAALEDAIRGHFIQNHPDLVEEYDRDLREGQQLHYLKSLDWTGPAFSLKQCT